MNLRIVGILGCLMVSGAMTEAAETVLFNESAAHLCYLAAVRGGDARDAGHCDSALTHQPLRHADTAATLSNRGLLLTRSGDLASAMRDHDRAIALAPELASLYVNRSNTLVRAQRLQDALGDLDRAIALAEDSLPAAYYNRALLHQTLVDPASAGAHAGQAVTLAPDNLTNRAYLDDLNTPERR
jgi:tetratricopeptide (TPR) repeat protein